MKHHQRHNPPPGARAVLAFAVTVVLAFLAAASVLSPDIGVQSADSTTLLPSGLDQILPAGLFE